MSCSFEAAAAGGPLRLALPEAGGDAVAAALALAAHEPLLAALEAWLKLPLDWRPAAGDGPPALLWAEAGSARVGLPWAVLAAAKGAPPSLLRWPDIAFEVDIAGFDEAPLGPEADHGVLLLPPSFEAPWRVALFADGLPLVAEAEWRGPGHAPVLAGAPQAGPLPRAEWRVLLAEPLVRPLPAWLGWTAVPPWQPGAAARLRGPEGFERAGHIAPALTGFGLWLG